MCVCMYYSQYLTALAKEAIHIQAWYRLMFPLYDANGLVTLVRRSNESTVILHIHTYIHIVNHSKALLQIKRCGISVPHFSCEQNKLNDKRYGSTIEMPVSLVRVSGGVGQVQHRNFIPGIFRNIASGKGVAHCHLQKEGRKYIYVQLIICIE